MIQAKCIQKFRDKSNHIYGYRLVDFNGQTQDVQPKNLKQAIVNKQIHVVNLTLTKDGRLVDTTEERLKSSVLGKEPQKGKSYPEKEYEWLLEISTIIFKALNCGEPGYCGDSDELHEFESDELEKIHCNSLAFDYLDCIKDEYKAFGGDREDFESEWGLVYLTYGNLKTKEVEIYLGSRTFQMDQFAASRTINNKNDLNELIKDAKLLYNDYKKQDAEYKKFYIILEKANVDEKVLMNKFKEAIQNGKYPQKERYSYADFINFGKQIGMIKQ